MGALSANQLKKLFKPKRGVKNTFKRLRKALEMLVDVDLKRIVASKNGKKRTFCLIFRPFRYF
jgi:hypothetical protein